MMVPYCARRSYRIFRAAHVGHRMEGHANDNVMQLGLVAVLLREFTNVASNQRANLASIKKQPNKQHVLRVCTRVRRRNTPS